MDCEQALAKLELSQSDIGVTDEAELAAATAHVQECAQCRTIAANRQEMDRAIALVCRDIPLPEGLEKRLVAAVSAELTSANTPAAPEAPRQNRRRHLGRWATVAAAALCVTAGIWYGLSGSSVTTGDLVVAATQRLNSQEAGPLFAGPFDPDQLFPADAINPPPSMQLGVYRRLLRDHGPLNVAMAPFEFRSGGRKVRGALIIAPVAAVSPPPAATSMAAAKPSYHSGFSAVTWRSRDYVYVCIIDGGDAPFRDLQRPTRSQTT